jgi:predicted enzyme related to lactoylglutathione lyase
MAIRGVKFVSIPVTDQDRALAFYTEKLGFRVVTDQPYDATQRWIELGIPGADTGIVLFNMGDAMKAGGLTNVSLWADDLEGTVQHLKSKGVEFVMEPKRFDWGSASIFKDPDGNRIMLSSR